MKLRNWLCGSAAALIAVSIPLAGMSAFGEGDNNEAATPTVYASGASTEEAITYEVNTTEADDDADAGLTEEEKEHQQYLRRHEFDKNGNAFSTSDLSLEKLWDNDRIIVKIVPYTGKTVKDVKLYLSSRSGAWEDKLIKELSFTDNADSVIMGDLRDKFDNSLFADANLKVVIGEGSDQIYYSHIKVDSLSDKHPYDEWITETDTKGKDVKVFYARNYDNASPDFYEGLLNWYVGDFEGKFVTDISFTVDITGDMSFVVYDQINGERDIASGILSKSGSYSGPIASTNVGSNVEVSVIKAEPGSKMVLSYMNMDSIDYAGEVDESIDTSVPYTLKNLSKYGHQYDVSMLPAVDGKFVFEFEPFDDKDYNTIYLYSYGNNDVYTKTPVKKGETTAELTVTADEMEILRNRTVTFDVQNLKVTKVSFVATPRDPENFQYGDNKCSVTLNDGQKYLYIPASAFEKLSGSGSDPVTITFETDSGVSDPWVQYRFGTTELHKITAVESVKGKTTFKASISENVSEVQEKGLYIYGNGITITNVNIDKGNPWTGGEGSDYVDLTADEIKDVELISAPESESAYTTTFNGFGVNKMYSQKNELGNGKYNQRFLMQVKTEDVADIESYSIIVSNGDKHVKINCYGLSSSITINGNSIKADEGCVFLSAAVVDVNDDIDLSYSEFMYD